MKKLLMTILGIGILSALNGCVVYSEPGRTSSSTVRSNRSQPTVTTSRSRTTTTTTTTSHKGNSKGGKSSACGPAYHWDGDSCVHNGKAKGHYK